MRSRDVRTVRVARKLEGILPAPPAICRCPSILSNSAPLGFGQHRRALEQGPFHATMCHFRMKASSFQLESSTDLQLRHGKPAGLLNFTDFNGSRAEGVTMLTVA